MILLKESDGCGEHEECVAAKEGVRECVCNPGYQRKGERCEVSECQRETIKCKSKGKKRNICNAAFQIDFVELKKEYSAKKCSPKNFGVDKATGKMWTKGKCQGKFQVRSKGCAKSPDEECGKNEKKINGKCVCKEGLHLDDKGNCEGKVIRYNAVSR
ncbi:tenascin-X-like [Argopecten irradians]|uniref:tenascin-X-like n=1 Tax=Argopecten irradians TaxID=31199 RepID=UPI0037201524